jgi:hypothetical protein
MMFKHHIGIDYSGAETAESRIPGLQVFMAATAESQKIKTPAAPSGQRWKWNRKETAQWLIDQANEDERFIAGIDHGFSFPANYMDRYGLHNWDQFLDDFCENWPTHEPNIYVEMLREQNRRTGLPDELRLTERHTSSAKSVFAWNGQGNVAYSTHAGIPWLRYIRQQVGKKVHFWPFDGWKVPESKSVIVEVYPAIFKKRYPQKSRNLHEQDAYAVARWMKELDKGGFLDCYFDPPLSDQEKTVASLEGWIFGIT